MPNTSYEMRVCESCGLRYPLVEGHPFGARCPVCMGNTHPAARYRLKAQTEPGAASRLQDERRADDYVLDPDHPSRARFAVLLDNIRSAWNVGSILRSADGFGFMHAYLCGITPTPEQEAVKKTSLGAEDSVTWSHHRDAVRLARGLKQEGSKIYALEEDVSAIDLSHAASVTYGSQQNVLILGSEVTGVDPELLDLCDAIFYIPMLGEKKSFNVAIAFGIAAYALRHLQVQK